MVIRPENKLNLLRQTRERCSRSGSNGELLVLHHQLAVEAQLTSRRLRVSAITVVVSTALSSAQTTC
jgi:hypothetical protein